MDADAVEGWAISRARDRVQVPLAPASSTSSGRRGQIFGPYYVKRRVVLERATEEVRALEQEEQEHWRATQPDFAEQLRRWVWLKLLRVASLVSAMDLVLAKQLLLPLLLQLH